MQLIGIDDDGAPQTHVFVHGYETVRAPHDLAQLSEQIVAAGLQGRLLVLRWGAWLESSDPTDGGLVRRLGRQAAQLALRWDRDSGPEQLVRGLGAAAWEAMRFWSHAAEAQRMGRQLRPLLELLERPGGLCLWGHSLGARLLQSALSAGDWRALGLQHVVLMAAAAEASADAWRHAASQVGGGLFNCYSPDDWALRLAPLREPLAGLQPLPLSSRQVVNLRFPFQHGDYWPGLSEIAQRVQSWRG